MSNTDWSPCAAVTLATSSVASTHCRRKAVPCGPSAYPWWWWCTWCGAPPAAEAAEAPTAARAEATPSASPATLSPLSAS